MEMGSGSLGASGSGGSGNTDPLHGLKFGKKIYFGDLSGGGVAGGSSSRAPASPVPALAPASSGGSVSSGSAVALRRGKGLVQGGRQQPPRCQVEGCRVDLTGAKPYYCRHKVCGMHSKSPKVIVAGMEQRFCQQCSRFHQLHEFDQGKRSCRRRLAGHNARRRKPTPGTLKSRYGLLSSSFHEDTGRFGSFLLDFSYPRPPAAARDVWPTVRVDRGSTSQWESGLDTPPSSGIMANMTHSYAPGSAGGSLFSSQEIPPSEGLGVSDSSCALSLLSTQPWGTTTDTRIRASTISDHNFGGHPMAQPGAAASFAGNAWSFKGHETGSSTHEIACEMGLGQAGGPGDGHFSGELELALQGDKQCIDPERGRVYCPPGNLMHWSL